MKYIIFAVVLLLSACSIFGSYYEAEPIGVGKGLDELKLSPCACMHVELIKEVPDWFYETI